MSFCAVCGESSPDRDGLCSYHIAPEDDWAVANRIMCDFVHRAIVPRRLPATKRDQVALFADDVGETVELAAG